jgi:hypothetical protein
MLCWRRCALAMPERLFKRIIRRELQHGQWWEMLVSPHVWIAFALIGVFFFSEITLDYFKLSVLIQSVTMAASVMVLYQYGFFAYRAILTRRMGRDGQLFLGIFLTWFGTLLRAAYVVAWRLYNYNHMDLPITSSWVNFFNGMVMIGGFLHLTAPRVDDDGRLTWIEIRRVGYAIGVGVALGWFLLWWNITD